MPNIDTRLRRLRDELVRLELDAIAVDDPHNRRYISGFGGSSGIAVIAMDEAWLVTDSRYYERAERESPLFQLERAGSQLLPSTGAVLERLGARRVGFEAQHVTVYGYGQLRSEVPNVEWVETVSVVNALRAVKDADEIAGTARAAELTDRAMAHAVATAAPGMTELELAWAIERFMRENGAEATAFDLIVASGPNGALPHHRTGNDRLRSGQPVVVDIGARVDGYNADLTRTFCLGEPEDPDYLAVWELVDRANRAGLESIRAGMTGRDADAVARDLITAAGYGDFFGHGLGHGVGLEIHELPRLSPMATAMLEAGQVATVEPGVYLPGRFGVRIEDLVLIESDGLRAFSHAPKAPTQTPLGEPERQLA
jgi:Xaa-Pro aminopeptidase